MESSLEKYLGQKLKVIIDRPLGSRHPRFGFIYPVNYGYLPDTKAPDGEEIDAYVLGVQEPIKEFEGTVVAIIHRTDDNDDKLVVVSEGNDLDEGEIRKLTDFQEKYFKSKIIKRSTI